ncbi:putative uncharacterized transposon-derived protein F54H12.3 [Lucilia cuprina]|nr:putative uncharacterized transposon-derived protein F54H12.3 [Lucilia cuprina]
MDLNAEKREIVNELHKQARKNFARRRVIVKGIYASYNNGYRYLLTVIDTFSKKAWAVAVKNKTAQCVTNAMHSVLNTSYRKPQNLQTDDGKEFSISIHHLMQTHKINHYSTYSVLKASIIEPF